MNRRQFMRNSACAAITLAAPAVRGSDKPVIGVRVRSGHPMASISTDFLGLGYEISSVARPGLLSRTNSVYVQLVRTLGLRGVVRVGGNTADHARYSPSAQVISSPFGTVVNDAVLQELGGFLQATGWKLIWALNLGRGSEADAIAEARAVLAVAGCCCTHPPLLPGRAKPGEHNRKVAGGRPEASDPARAAASGVPELRCSLSNLRGELVLRRRTARGE